MTDKEMMVEQIRNAMEAVDKAHEKMETLREETNPENMKAFRDEALRLYEELRQIKEILVHEDQYLMDELSSMLNQMMTGHPSAYHRFLHLEDKHS